MFVRTRRFSLPSDSALSNVQREMEQLFGRFLQNPAENGASSSSWRGAIALWEEAEKVFLEIELPGVKKESVDLTVHNGLLRVTGERTAPEGDRKYRVNERVYGRFDQSIALPEDVDDDSIDAQLSEGVLRIVLTRRPEAQPKKVTLKD